MEILRQENNRQEFEGPDMAAYAPRQVEMNRNRAHENGKNPAAIARQIGIAVLVAGIAGLVFGLLARPAHHLAGHERNGQGAVSDPARENPPAFTDNTQQEEPREQDPAPEEPVVVESTGSSVFSSSEDAPVMPQPSQPEDDAKALGVDDVQVTGQNNAINTEESTFQDSKEEQSAVKEDIPLSETPDTVDTDGITDTITNSSEQRPEHRPRRQPVQKTIVSRVLDNMDRQDKNLLNRYFENNPSGQYISWYNSRSNLAFEVVLHPAWTGANNQICRSARIKSWQEPLDHLTIFYVQDITGCRTGRPLWLFFE